MGINNSFLFNIRYILVCVVCLAGAFFLLNSCTLEVLQTKVEQKVIIKVKWGSNAGEISQSNMEQDGQTPGESLNPIALDRLGNIYVGDSVNNRIQKYNSNGKLLNEIKLPKGSQFIDYISASRENAVYVLISRGHPKIIKLSAGGKVMAIYDLGNAGRLEKNRDGKVKLNKEGLFSGRRNKLFIDVSGNIYALGSDLLKLDKNGKIINRLGPYIDDFFVYSDNKVYARYIYGRGDVVEQYDKDFKYIDTGWGIYKNVIWPNYADSRGSVYGFTTDAHHKDVFLAKYAVNERKLYKFPIKKDDLALEKWAIDSSGNIYFTNPTKDRFQVIKMSIAPQKKK